MAKKSALTEDELRLVLNLESTEAQQKIHEVTKEIKDLEKMNRDYRKEMMKLEMQGKKNSKAWKNLNDVVNENNQQINKSREIVRELEKTMSVTELTMGQLKKQAQQLQRQLDNTSKSLNPKEYAETEKRLMAVKGRMAELKNEAKSMGSMISKRGALATFFGNIYTKLAQFAVDGLKKAKEFIAASTEMAAKAEGIDHAFNRIANKDYLKSLRTQTKGLISDFTLMQSSVRAENFGIPLQQLGKYLEFAQNRARDTGESVDYLVESIVNGIGRKSPLILDNLGISTVRLQEEVKKTGDFTAAVGNIIEEEMANAGTAIDTATDSATRKKVAWENLMLVTGKFFTGFRSGWDDFVTHFVEGVTKIIAKSDDAIKVYDDQIKKVADLELNIGSLAGEYDILSKKASLNETEQKRLDAIIRQLVDVVPEARGEIGEYGKIMDVNTGKVREFIEANRDMLEAMREAAKEKAKENMEDARREYEKAKALVDQGGKTVTKTEHVGMFTTVTKEVDKSTMPEALKEMEAAGKKLAAAEKEWEDKSGKTYERQSAKRYEFYQQDIKLLKEWIDAERNAKDEFLPIAKEVYNARIAVENANINPDDGSGRKNTKSRYDEELKIFEDNSKEKILALKNQYLEEQKTEKWYADETVKLQEKYYSDKIAMLKRHGKSTVDVETQQADFRINQQKNADEQLLNQFKLSTDALLNAIDASTDLEQRELQEKVDAGLITSREYLRQLQSIELEAVRKRIEFARNYLDEVENTEFQTTESKDKELQRAQGILDKYLDDEVKLIRKSNTDKLKEGEEFERKRKSVLEEFGIASAEYIYDKELEALDAAFEEGLLKEDEYQKTRMSIKAKYYSEYAKKAVEIAGSVADAVNAYHEMEANSLEAQKQRELSVAGDNAEKRKEIEEEYAQKELDLKKKQAGANATIQIAQATSAAALAIANVWAQHAGNPILAGILTALAAATTAIQIASIMKQRSAIMSTTLDKSSSSSSGTGARVVTGRESGGYVDVNRAQDGKYFKALLNPKKRGFIERPTVIVGDGPAGKSKEWVASNDALENPTVAPIIKLLNEAQQTGNIRTIDMNHLMRSRMAGFAGGGFIDNKTDSSMQKNYPVNDTFSRDTSADMELIRETRDLLKKININGGIKAHVVYSEFEKKKEILEQSRKIGSK